MKKGQNGRESLRRLKSIVGCNASKRRRRRHNNITRMNYELNELTENAHTVGFIESRGIAWLGHVMRMDDKRTPKRILDWKPIGTKIRGRPRKR